MLFVPKRDPKGFHYEPKYKADGTQKERRPEFHFSRTSVGSAQGRRSLIVMLFLVILLIYLLIFFRKFQNAEHDQTFKVENIEVE